MRETAAATGPIATVATVYAVVRTWREEIGDEETPLVGEEWLGHFATARDAEEYRRAFGGEVRPIAVQDLAGLVARVVHRLTLCLDDGERSGRDARGALLRPGDEVGFVRTPDAQDGRRYVEVWTIAGADATEALADATWLAWRSGELRLGPQ